MNHLLLVCLLLTGCATTSTTPLRSHPRSPLVTKYPDPSKKLELRFTLGDPSLYQLVDIPTQAVLATANSAIRPADLNQGLFRGTVDVMFSPDSDALCIQEGVSDAAPSTRYILIRRDGSSKYEVRYLLPESNTRTDDPEDEFPYSQPDVISLTKDTIRMKYAGSKYLRPVWINSINSTQIPTTDE